MCLNPRWKYNNGVVGVPRGLSDREVPSYVRMVKSMRRERIQYPCGCCKECLSARRKQWRTRLIHEVQFGGHTNALFVTLTIDESNYEKYRANPNLAVRRFTDLLRKTYGRSVKYFLVTELGGERGRLHFHGILFDLPFIPARKNPSFKVINRLLHRFWKIGITWVGWCREETASYIVKYITKVDESNLDFTPRVYCSPGFGGCYVTSQFVDYVKRLKGVGVKVQSGNLQVSAPRYYLDKALSIFERKYYSLLHGILDPPNPCVYKGVEYSDYSAMVEVRQNDYYDSLSRRTSRPLKSSFNDEFSPNLDFNLSY